MIQNYESWLNENLNRAEEVSLHALLYMCLGSFDPTGGNSMGTDSLNKLVISLKPDLFKYDGPDYWVNCGDFDEKIRTEIMTVEKAMSTKRLLIEEVRKHFAEYGMEIWDLGVDEVIVALRLPHNVHKENETWIKANAETVVKFYTETKPQGLKALEKKLGPNYFTGKEYGI